MDYQTIRSVADIDAYIGDAQLIAFDFETSAADEYRKEEFAALDAHKSDITGISLSTAAGTARYVPLRHRIGSNADVDAVMCYLTGRVFHNHSIVKIAHNLSFEAMFLYKHGIVMQEPVYDTIAAAQLTLKDDNTFRDLHDSGLKTLVPYLYGVELPTFESVVQGRYFDELDPDDFAACRYACADSDYALQLYPVRVLLHGLTSADAGAHLHVYSVLRNRQRKTCWRHPSNYCVADEGGGRLGYGQIAGFTYGGNAEYNYSAVPEWMPNDGYLETEFALTKAVIERGYYDVDISTWLLPLVKPKAFGDNGLMSWDEIGIIGLSQYGQNSPLLFRFNIERGGSVVGESRDTLCIGLRGSLPDTSGWFDSRDGSIRTNHMYVSIR